MPIGERSRGRRRSSGGSGSADLVYSTFLGGDGDDYCYDVALDGGRAYLTGFTDGVFPTTPGAYNETSTGFYDGFLAVISPSGLGAADFEYGTMFGGTSSETPYGIATYSGDAFIAGYTYSSDFPTTPNAYDQTYNGGKDVFVTKVDI